MKKLKIMPKISFSIEAKIPILKFLRQKFIELGFKDDKPWNDDYEKKAAFRYLNTGINKRLLYLNHHTLADKLYKITDINTYLTTIEEITNKKLYTIDQLKNNKIAIRTPLNKCWKLIGDRLTFKTWFEKRVELDKQSVLLRINGTSKNSINWDNDDSMGKQVYHEWGYAIIDFDQILFPEDIPVEYRGGQNTQNIDNQQNTKEMKKAPIAYKLIKLYPGSVAIGTIIELPTTLECEEYPEFWEPIYQIKPSIRIAGYDLEYSDNKAKFGCQSFTLGEIYFIKKMLNNPINASITIEGTTITNDLIKEIVENWPKHWSES